MSFTRWLRARWPGAWLATHAVRPNHVLCTTRGPEDWGRWLRVWPGASVLTLLCEPETGGAGGSLAFAQWNRAMVDAVSRLREPPGMTVVLCGAEPVEGEASGDEDDPHHAPPTTFAPSPSSQWRGWLSRSPRPPGWSHLTASFEEEEAQSSWTCVQWRRVPGPLSLYVDWATPASWDAGLVVQAMLRHHPQADTVIDLQPAPERVWRLGCLAGMGVGCLYGAAGRGPDRRGRLFLVAAPEEGDPILDLAGFWLMASRDEWAARLWYSPAVWVSMLGVIACSAGRCPLDPLSSGAGADVNPTLPPPSPAPTVVDAHMEEISLDDNTPLPLVVRFPAERPIPSIWDWVSSFPGLKSLHEHMERCPELLRDAVFNCVRQVMGLPCPPVVDTLRYAMVAAAAALPPEVTVEAPKDGTSAQLWAWLANKVLLLHAGPLLRIGVIWPEQLLIWLRVEAHRMAWTIGRAPSGANQPHDIDDQQRSLWGWGHGHSLAPTPGYYFSDGAARVFRRDLWPAGCLDG